MSKEFSDALAREAAAKAKYDNLSPLRHKEILRYLNALKSKSSLVRNIERVCGQLTGEGRTGNTALDKGTEKHAVRNSVYRMLNSNLAK